MMNRKKSLTIAMTTALTLSIGAFAGYQAYADTLTKQEKADQLKKELAADEQKLDSLKGQDQIQANIEQGQKVKQKSAELGKLEKELNPNKQQELQEAITSVKAALADIESLYKEQGKSLDVIQLKKAALAKIEQDFNGKQRTADELLTEIAKLRAMR